MYWYGDTWTLGAGIRNIFDEAPPRVDGNELTSIGNVPLGTSYDLFGRTYFLNLIQGEYATSARVSLVK